ncbi:MAG: hypothetical protein M3451_12310 [Chloroflexota bacterium]|nr:hypothetical protein [Chloroflexota bacterium]
MRVLYIEGIAIHDVPESCVGVREGAGEALTGVVWAGRLSRERKMFRVPTLSKVRKGHAGGRDHRE